jgi:hypothetical protein
MSPERMRVLAQRAGYIAGKRAASTRWNDRVSELALQEATVLYPLPTAEQPRVLTLHKPMMRRRPSGYGMHERVERVEYRVVNDQLEVRYPECEYRNAREWTSAKKNREDIEAFLELFDNPTESVEVE